MLLANHSRGSDTSGIYRRMEKPSGSSFFILPSGIMLAPLTQRKGGGTMGMIRWSWVGILGVIWWIGIPRAGGEENEMVLGSQSDTRGALILEPTKKAGMRPEEAGAGPSNLLQGLGGLLFLAGAAGAGWLWLKHFKGRGGGLPTGNPGLAVVERLAIGGRRELLLVRANGQDLVLANSQQEIKLLAMLSQPSSPSASPLPKGHFADLIRQEEGSDEETARSRTATESLDWPGTPQRT